MGTVIIAPSKNKEITLRILINPIHKKEEKNRNLREFVFGVVINRIIQINVERMETENGTANSVINVKDTVIHKTCVQRHPRKRKRVLRSNRFLTVTFNFTCSLQSRPKINSNFRSSKQHFGFGKQKLVLGSKKLVPKSKKLVLKENEIFKRTFFFFRFRL